MSTPIVGEAEVCLRVAVSVGLGTDPVAPHGAPTVTAEVLRLAQQHRVVGLLAAAVDQGMNVASECGPAIREAHIAAVRTSLLCEETAVLSARALAAHNIDFRILKGVAAAHLDFPDPALRQCGDTDVMVPRAALAAALAALAAAGFTRPEPPVRPWWERRFGKAVVLIAPNGGELDLHLTLTGGYYGLAMRSEALFAAVPDSFTLAATKLRALPAHLRLLNAACHSVLGGGSGLRAMRDVAQITVANPATWVSARRFAEDVQAEAVLATALGRAWSQLALDPSHPAAEWASGFTTTASDSARLAEYGEALGTTWLPEGRGALKALSLLDRVGYLTGLAFPSRASLRARNRTVGQHARRMLGAMRGTS